MSPPIPFAKRNRPVLVKKHVFSSSSIAGDSLSLKLSTTGKKPRFDGEALVLDDNRYPDVKDASMANYATVMYDKNPVKFTFGREDIVVAHVANKQIFRKNESGNLFPSVFEKAVVNVQGDTRPCHGFVQLLGIQTGDILGFQITNDQIYAVVGSDPVLCKKEMFVLEGGDECNTCTTNGWDCDNFRTNPAWMKFKMGLTEENFSRYLMFRKWQDDCQANGISVTDWDTFKSWHNNNTQFCNMGNKQSYSDWRTDGGHFTEYCLVTTWTKWIEQYLQYYPCGDAVEATCGQGYTSTALWGSANTVCGSNPTCSHYFTSGNGSNCYDKKADSTSDDYAVGRNCCCQKPASFRDLIPLMRREACDPLMDWIKLSIGVDRSEKTVNFYIGDELKFSTTIGLRSHEKNRVLELGGFSKPHDMESAVFMFGNGAGLDESLPDNYFRYRTTNENLSRSALVNVHPVSEYKEVYKTKNGEFQKAQSGFFAVENNTNAFRFGQGNIFKIKSYSKVSRWASRAYEDPRNYGLTECCGSSACGRSCMPSCQDEDCENLLDYIDTRGFDIEFERPSRKRVGDDIGLTSYADEDGGAAGSPVCVRAKLVKVEEGAQYWAKHCKDDFVGINPYN